jgi:hypothetical protein
VMRYGLRRLKRSTTKKQSNDEIAVG